MSDDDKSEIDEQVPKDGARQHQTPPAPPKPPIPTLFTITAVLLAVALVGGSYLLGQEIGSSSTPTPTASQPAGPKVPDKLGGYTLSKADTPSQEPGSGSQIARGSYTDGTNQFVVVLTRPVEDLEQFMTDAGVKDLQEAGGETGASSSESEGSGATQMCGRSTDTTFAACGRLVRSDQTGTTGQLIVATTDLTPDAVRELLGQIPS